PALPPAQTCVPTAHSARNFVPPRTVTFCQDFRDPTIVAPHLQPTASTAASVLRLGTPWHAVENLSPLPSAALAKTLVSAQVPIRLSSPPAGQQLRWLPAPRRALRHHSPQLFPTSFQPPA